MVVMSSLRLLLCALAAMFPGVLGVSSVRLSDIKVNNSLMLNQKLNRKILLNLNGPPLVKVVSELQSVFRDMACRNCTSCMERAIKAHKIHSHVISHQPNVNDLYYYQNNNDRKKRNTIVPNEFGKNMDKTRSTANVTRYIKAKKVIALEVNEINEGKSTCKVYSVKKSLPCESTNDIISLKTNRRNKKIKQRTSPYSQVTVVTEKIKSTPSVYKKREVDNSQVLESFMPSIEELY